MEKVELDGVDLAALSGAADRRDVSAALGATDVAVMYYELEPGEAFSGGFHAHLDQEELFFVLEGEATWDTEADEPRSSADRSSGQRGGATASNETANPSRGPRGDGETGSGATVTVEAGEAVRFAPGEFQHGYNDSEGLVRALAIGAPSGMDETVARFTCPACGEHGEHDVDIDEERGVTVTACRACGNEIRTDLGD